MSELLTAAQMRAIEQAAIESGEVTGLELMERAGQGVVEAIFEEWPELGAGDKEAGGQPPDPRSILGQKKRAVVLCGPGNNGGDGFVVARLLQARGWDVEVFLYGDAKKLPPDARVNYERWCNLGQVNGDLSDQSLWACEACDLVIDAVFGTGLSRCIDSQLVDSLASLVGPPRTKLIAIDGCTGVDLDSGKYLVAKPDELDPMPDLVVTFHKAKVGHYVGRLTNLYTKVTVVDIGLNGFDPNEQIRLAGEYVDLVDCSDVIYGLKKGIFNPEGYQTNKYTHGHALILTGGSGRTGSARLAARGALRIGAGLVTLGVPPNAQQEVACQITALMMERVGDAKALEVVLQDERLNGLCLGPGMGHERARQLVPVALATKRATVLDADALSAFADNPRELFELLHEHVVLTPHGGEFARLFPDIADTLAETPTKGPAYSKVDATRAAAARAGCTVLFKGPDTVIASPDGVCAVNAAVYDRAAPWLATAGSGDVLAGFITGLLARGLSSQHAAEAAAWLHVECARTFGAGLIAEDLPEMLPQVLKSLENEQF